VPDTPYAGLDALYLQIFSSVGNDQLDNVLSALVLLPDYYYEIHKLAHLEELLECRHGQLEGVMCDMVALVDIPSERNHLVKIYHTSLPDFLLDPCRSRESFLDPHTSICEPGCPMSAF
jgi:hypothetical protein